MKAAKLAPTLAVVLSAVLAALAAPAAQAWGLQGHRAVGAIAEQLLRGSRAEKEVRALLRQGETLEQATTWMDCVKGTACGAVTPEMQAYAQANPGHPLYHYTDVPFQLSEYHEHGVGTNGNDIVHLLRQSVWVLQGKDGAAVNPHRFSKRQALLLLAHLAGDIHQPLHVGSAYLTREGAFVVPTRADLAEGGTMTNSAGGNALLLDIPAAPEVIPASGEAAAEAGAQAATAAVTAVTTTVAGAVVTPKPARHLHQYWDFTLTDAAMRRLGARTSEQFAQAAIAGKPVVAEVEGDPAEWSYLIADETLAVSKLAHAGLKAGPAFQQRKSNGGMETVWTVTLPERYADMGSVLAKDQLIKGGYRLAALLRAIWP